MTDAAGRAARLQLSREGNGVHQPARGAPLKAPFPYFGGKARVADLVWERLGEVDNYCEPFAGTLAVLLRRPREHFAADPNKAGRCLRVETANDRNCYIVNFWRAVRADPEKVAEYADWPVTEADLHARHKWLVRSAESAAWRRRMVEDPDCYDSKIAGWWVWGQSCWIGSGWCAVSLSSQIPALGGEAGKGVVSHHCPAGEGGVNARSGTCAERRAWLVDWMRRLADRLRMVRVCYGHWSRICDSLSTLTRLGTTGVFLDPPYPVRRYQTGGGSRHRNLYATDAGGADELDLLRDEVLTWCRKWGPDRQIRVAVCGYEGDGYESLAAEGWSEESWTTRGGYGNQKAGGRKSANARRERIWFSPACRPAERTLLDGLG